MGRWCYIGRWCGEMVLYREVVLCREVVLWCFIVCNKVTATQFPCPLI